MAFVYQMHGDGAHFLIVCTSSVVVVRVYVFLLTEWHVFIQGAFVKYNPPPLKSPGPFPKPHSREHAVRLEGLFWATS